MTNVGRWAPWYASAATPSPYANTVTYDLAADWLAGLAVEDWGCGTGWFRTVHDGPYTGVDGTRTEWTDVVADLVDYRSTTEGVLLRHVLEHNPEPDWRRVLGNALASATKRVVVVVFTPDAAPRTRAREIARTAELDVGDYALPHRAIDAALDGWDVVTAYNRRWWDDPVWDGAVSAPWAWDRATVVTDAFYGTETVWRAQHA